MNEENNNKIILISIDALRADHVGCYGYQKPTTPIIDHLAENGILFENTFAQAAGTPRSFYSLFTSNYLTIPLPSKQFVFFFPEGHVTLPEVLRHYGYTTGAFQTNTLIHGYNRKFDASCSPLSRDASDLKWKITQSLKRRGGRGQKLGQVFSQGLRMMNLDVPYERARDLNEKALNWLNEGKKQFLWIHYMDPHKPFLPVKPSISPLEMLKINGLLARKSLGGGAPLSQGNTEKLIQLYDDEIRYVDTCIGDFLLKLRVKGLLKESTIIITSDHGEEFYEHGALLHNRRAYEELVKVPLIIYGLKEKEKRIRELVSHINLAPTIIDLINGEIPGEFVGKSLLPLIEGKKRQVGEGVVLAPDLDIKAYRTKQWKLIRKKNMIELYKLQKDPKEQRNVAKKYPEKVKELNQRMEEELGKQEKRKLKERIREIRRQI